MEIKLVDPKVIHPDPNIDELILIKPTIDKDNIDVGEYSYISDNNFLTHVIHHYEESGDKLIIGKFCQIAKGVEFIMNGANHQMDSVSTYPFFAPYLRDMDFPPEYLTKTKGDTIIGNDVWLGQNSTILPGIKIGDGAIIALNTVVTKDVEPYTIVAGNPGKFIRKRFDDELVNLMLEFKWWDKSVDEINNLIPILTSCDLNSVKDFIKKELNK